MKKLAIALAVFQLVLPQTIFAISSEESFFRRNGILFYDPNQPIQSGNGCLGLGVPTINDPDGLARAINTYINETIPDSPLGGLGQSFVSGSIRSGINPMAVVAIARKESSLGLRTPHDMNTGDPSYNAFGLTATESQPHVVTRPNGTDPNTGRAYEPRRWYRYESWEASLDGQGVSRDHPQYLKLVYLDLGLETFEEVINKYAPSADGNDPNGYAKTMTEWVQEIVNIAGDSISCGQGGGSITGVECPPNLGGPDPNNFGYYKMPDPLNNEYVIYSREARRYGSKELVCVLYTVAQNYYSIYGQTSRLYIGDLNAGAPHRSHKWGVAVDVDAGGTVAAADYTGNAIGVYSTEATIDLGKAFVDTGVTKNIWWCEPGSVAKPSGAPLREVHLSGNDGSMEAIRSYAESLGTPIKLYCISGHRNHFHVDISNQFKGPVHAP